MLSGILWLITNIGLGFYNIFWAITHPVAWLDWSDKAAVARWIYYGGSVEFFFAVLDIFLLLFIVGLFRRPFLWGVVRILEGFANGVGRIFAWAGLIMVLQQIMIVFLQRIFRVSEISVGPFGIDFTKDLSWWSEELKLYNALIVALCCAYTFTQGGHVRVDLFYSGMKHHSRRVVDMLGSIFFMLPTMVMIWLYGWYFLWRHLVTPKINATEQFQMVERKSALLKWNIETTGFSPNGFDAYFLFKILLVAFAGMMFLQAWAFFFRSYLEWVEGPESAEKYLDKDSLEDETADRAAEIH
ncbi:TRAP transporter small permease subunit [Algicella marina]|uniref:TRAP transporter small permease protein n=1 Tax=Algicella marina TaxID=2683284 RepID=A0A6P1T0Z6_9RHOB|nr:TRAP transporter small permease subunit [Algicella marina]QHQ34959.1 TRAP transporter small permease subunit [Algicella marina]